MKGSITRRGKASWRLKFDIGRDPGTGKRQTRYVTVRGTKKDAQRELNRLLAQAEDGTLVEPSKLTVADYLRDWIKDAETMGLGLKTVERHRGLIENQIIPHLGAHPLQKLKPAHVRSWHATLLRSGRVDGGPLAARTVGHAHRVLHRALEQAAAVELVSRNVASAVSPPAVEEQEMEALTAAQVAEVLTKLRGVASYPLIVLALATGMRRGELLALRWSDLDLDAGKLRVERSLEQTKTGGLRFKPPKTKHGRRTITLPANAVAALRAHRKKQLELRVATGSGKLPDDALVFGHLDGSPRSPRALSKEWKRLVAAHKLPKVTFHALRHSHASALIASGLDVLTISRRLGHGSPAITLTVYGHLFANTDDRAAEAINAALAPALAE